MSQTLSRLCALLFALIYPASVFGRVIDAKGKFLIPGLWDMHVHSLFEGRTEFFFPLFSANGVTGVREMSSTFAPEEIQQIRRRIENGEVIGPRIGLSAVRIVEGKGNSSTPGFEYVTTPAEGREIVRLRKRQGADFVKVYNLVPRDVYFAMVDEAKRQHIPRRTRAVRSLGPGGIECWAA